MTLRLPIGSRPTPMLDELKYLVSIQEETGYTKVTDLEKELVKEDLFTSSQKEAILRIMDAFTIMNEDENDQK